MTDVDEPGVLHDEGMGPEEPDEVLEDPENAAAAILIRESTLPGANER